MKKIIQQFWECIHEGNFDGLEEVMKEEARVWLPNTKEVFQGREKYITFNKIYPGRWYVDLESIYELGDTVITVARIYNENNESAYATSFFKIENNLIVEIKEYWGENGQPPEWRIDEKHSERY